MPADRHRALFATEAASAAIHLAVSHEFGHLLRGHLSYLISHYGQKTLAEIGLGRTDQVPARVLRAMEVDADTLAVTSMADNLVHWLSNQPSLGARDFLRAHLFGFGVLFALMADAERLDRPPPERSHPRPHIRYFLAAPRVERIVTETHPAAFADANPISESYDELAKMFPSLWKTES
jgi:hypothetical protein